MQKHMRIAHISGYPGNYVTIQRINGYKAALESLQGYGNFGDYALETPSLIRYGQITNDEFFVTYEAAKNGCELNIKKAEKNNYVV